MSDINTPQGREHPEDPAEGADDASATDGSPNADDAAPDEDMSSYNIQPPPTDAEVPGVPDASDALGDDDTDEPGTNATGVGV